LLSRKWSIPPKYNITFPQDVTIENVNMWITTNKFLKCTSATNFTKKTMP
jgi:hypothetical protein